MRSSALFSAAVGLLVAAGVAQGQESTLFPAGSILVQGANGGDPEMMFMTEETGLVSYAGRGCNDASSDFIDVKGTLYGSNEWSKVFARAQRFGQAGKIVFDQLLLAAPPSDELTLFEEEERNAEDLAGNRISRSVTGKDMPQGRIVLVKDALGCIEDQHPSFERTTFQGYAVFDNTIVSVTGTYNSGDPSVAEQVYHEVVRRAGLLK